MKNFLMNILLGGAIIILSIAVNEDSVICGCIGGALVGIYNAIICKED